MTFYSAYARYKYAKRCCRSQVSVFAYIWHPAGIDGFDDYYGTISRFSENLDSNWTWTTTINLSYWVFLSTNIPDFKDKDKDFDELPEHMKKLFDENRTCADFPPKPVLVDSRDTRTPISQGFSTPIIAFCYRLMGKDQPFKRRDIDEEEAKSSKNMSRVEERSSCIVITGDVDGRFWTCSVWSSLVDEKIMAANIDSISLIIRQFIHQQRIGRGLVFIFLLGCICEKLVGEYKVFIERLEDFVGLGVSTCHCYTFDRN